MDNENHFDAGRWVEKAQNASAPLSERHQAFGELVTRFQDRAFGTAYAILGGDHARAEEAAQEAFVVAWTHLNQLQTPDAFPGWLRRIVIRQCSRARRRREPATVPVVEADGRASELGNPEMLAVQNERADQIRAAIAVLPPTERVVVVLFISTRTHARKSPHISICRRRR